MRDILSKVMTGSMIAGAALLVAACGGGGGANNTATDNTLGTDVYNTELPADSNLGGFNTTGNVGADGNVGVGTDTTGNTTAGNTTNTM